MVKHSFIFPPGDFAADSKRARVGLLVFACYLGVFGLAMSGFDPVALIRGLGAIIVAPDLLINDYVGIAGMGPAFVNASLCALMALGLLKLSRVDPTGPIVAGIFTIAGFSLFGKNVANVIPGLLGVFLFSVASKRPFSENIIVALFGTALSPLSSSVAFGLGIPAPWNIIAAVATGTATGFVMAPIARHVLDFHRGYNLYNMGFAAGFVGTVIMSALKALGVSVTGGFMWAERGPGAVAPYMAAFFLGLIVVGASVDRNWAATYRRLLSSSGRLVSDFVRFYGMGTTLVNMGVMGLVGLAVVFAIGGSWNGPMLGGVLTIVGFSAFGKHPRNALPPMLGAAVMAALSKYGLAAPASQLAVLFASTLAPVAGEYGMAPGFIVGMLHLVLVQVVGTLHGGLDLYNNGFAGGLAAGLFVPVLEWLREWRRHEV
jgi:hypothetical protein